MNSSGSAGRLEAFERARLRRRRGEHTTEGDQYQRVSRFDEDPVQREAGEDCWAYTEESRLP